MSAAEYEKLINEKARPLFDELTEKCIREKILRPAAIYGYCNIKYNINMIENLSNAATTVIYLISSYVPKLIAGLLILSIGVIVIAGFLLITASGAENQITKGKDILKKINEF